ncbi:MAG: TIM barrel protein [Pirellulaceae bacterium]|nr:TIM barrel protein [Pirellulaceae bacterium]
MKLSLSVRIAEGFLSKEEAILTLAEVADLAVAAGYDAICMRASQIGIQSSADQIDEAVKTLKDRELDVSMATPDFAIVYNNDQGPDCLRNITPYLDVAERFEAPLVRVAIKKDADIPHVQRAADEAAERGIRLAHQCHTLSLFETIENIERSLAAIDRPNFGLIYEPANLELCDQDYGPQTLERLAPKIFNVYLQNQIIRSGGSVTLNTWCRGPVEFDIIQIHDPGGIDFARVQQGLQQIGYQGSITVHQCAPEGQTPQESAAATAQFLRSSH